LYQLQVILEQRATSSLAQPQSAINNKQSWEVTHRLTQ